jgi:hypothetical protein
VYLGGFILSRSGASAWARGCLNKFSSELRTDDVTNDRDGSVEQISLTVTLARWSGARTRVALAASGLREWPRCVAPIMVLLPWRGADYWLSQVASGFRGRLHS